MKKKKLKQEIKNLKLREIRHSSLLAECLEEIESLQEAMVHLTDVVSSLEGKVTALKLDPISDKDHSLRRIRDVFSLAETMFDEIGGKAEKKSKGKRNTRPESENQYRWNHWEPWP